MMEAQKNERLLGKRIILAIVLICIIVISVLVVLNYAHKNDDRTNHTVLSIEKQLKKIVGSEAKNLNVSIWQMTPAGQLYYIPDTSIYFIEDEYRGSAFTLDMPGLLYNGFDIDVPVVETYLHDNGYTSIYKIMNVDAEDITFMDIDTKDQFTLTIENSEAFDQ